MKRLLPFVLLACGVLWIGVSEYRSQARASSPLQCPEPSAAIEAHADRIEALERAIEQVRSQARSDTDDVAALVVLGSSLKRTYRGGVECEGGLYLPNEPGARASRALRASGMCETPGMVADLEKRQ